MYNGKKAEEWGLLKIKSGDKSVDPYKMCIQENGEGGTTENITEYVGNENNN